MFLFNRNNKKLEEKIISLQRDIERLENNNKTLKDVIEKLSEDKEKLLKGNEKLVNWIFKLIENNGYQVPEGMPYFSVRSVDKTVMNYATTEDILNPVQIQEVIIPEIRIQRMYRERL